MRRIDRYACYCFRCRGHFSMSNDKSAVSQRKDEFLTFYVGSQEFCIDIMLVREIRSWTSVTTLPHAPVDVLGVMNLRGIIVPIVDLSARLGFGPCERRARTSPTGSSKPHGDPRSSGILPGRQRPLGGALSLDQRSVSWTSVVALPTGAERKGDRWL